ncbi:hypothetical protein [Halomarina oriensis]|uniref:Uncharacterized protein n=1 Tax=Halomarina oriensis TaxID=671145 RepID=A0A6B0GPG6_9EURY|nr:hypothetical protein [Halomarina oriensis]MWG36724.1 hypothetical protein [Halomarina oriensis]
MATPPHLVEEGGTSRTSREASEAELKLDLGIGHRRRRFRLTDGAENLLRDCGYEKADVVPWTVAKALVIVGGAHLPEGNDARETTWAIKGADGGRDATDDDLRELATYLRRLTVEDRALDTLREHVERTRLSEYLDPDELRGRTEKVGSLNDIVRDL